MNPHRPSDDPHPFRAADPVSGEGNFLSESHPEPGYAVRSYRERRPVVERLRGLPPPLLLAGVLAGAMLALGLMNRHELALEQQAQQHLTRSVLEITNDFSRFLPLIAPPGARSGPLAFSAAPPPSVAAREAAPSSLVKTVKVERGDTLMGVLTAAGVAVDEARGAITALRTVFDPRDLKLGQHITLTFSRVADELKLSSLSMAPTREDQLKVSRVEGTTYTARTKTLPLNAGTAKTDGVIKGSLSGSGERLGIPSAIMAKMIHLFSYRVDFQRDLKSGDRFSVYYDRSTDPAGHVVKLGPLLYASLSLSDGKALRYYRFAPEGHGSARYYTADGRSIRRSLLRTPIDGARISSGFGMRINPILGYSKEMHPGIDFAAPMGTPIMAAGDGTIEKVGWVRGYGRYIRIRHDATYSTTYGHMSAFAKIHVGEHVRQGEVIGFVGSTGRSTGPHLYYEVIKNGVKINPMSASIPVGGQLSGKILERFRHQVATIDRALGIEDTVKTAAAPTPKRRPRRLAEAGR